MISYYKTKEQGLVILADKPPVLDVSAYSTRVCIIPNTCHGCGNCRFCGDGCTCNQATCTYKRPERPVIREGS